MYSSSLPKPKSMKSMNGYGHRRLRSLARLSFTLLSSEKQNYKKTPPSPFLFQKITLFGLAQLKKRDSRFVRLFKISTSIRFNGLRRRHLGSNHRSRSCSPTDHLRNITTPAPFFLKATLRSAHSLESRFVSLVNKPHPLICAQVVGILVVGLLTTEFQQDFSCTTQLGRGLFPKTICCRYMRRQHEPVTCRSQFQHHLRILRLRNEWEGRTCCSCGRPLLAREG